MTTEPLRTTTWEADSSREIGWSGPGALRGRTVVETASVAAWFRVRRRARLTVAKAAKTITPTAHASLVATTSPPFTTTNPAATGGIPSPRYETVTSTESAPARWS